MSVRASESETTSAPLPRAGWGPAVAVARLAVLTVLALALLMPPALFVAVHLAGCGDSKPKNEGGRDQPSSPPEAAAPETRPDESGEPSVAELARRQQCAKNLMNLGKALGIYQSNNNGSMPKVQPGFRADMSRTGIPDSIDTQGSLWLLVETRAASADIFICPSDEGAVAFDDRIDKVSVDDPFPRVDDSGKLPASGPGGLRTCSYSYQIPQAEHGQPDRETAWATRFAVLADRAPPMDTIILPDAGSSDSREKAEAWLRKLDRDEKVRVNSPNHHGQGQQVLFQDGHVDWTSHPWVGIRDDNIYTRGGADWVTSPADRVRGRLPADLNAITTADGPADDEDSFLVNITYGRAVTGE